jgi:hypothetical protein
MNLPVQIMKLIFILALTLFGCQSRASSRASSHAPVPDAAPVASTVSVLKTASTTSSTLSIENDTDSAVKVFFAFGADSAVRPSSPGWAFCKGTGLNCDFELAKRDKQSAPLAGKWLNATISFDKPVTCDTTKAEVNINNPSWYDIADISLVDGFNKFIAIDTVSSAGALTLGPPNGVNGNEKVFGLYPNGCDICTARQNPPCNMKPGTGGCKTGTQYKPDVPCQWQGPTMGGGTQVTVRLLAGVPAK